MKPTIVFRPGRGLVEGKASPSPAKGASAAKPAAPRSATTPKVVPSPTPVTLATAALTNAPSAASGMSATGPSAPPKSKGRKSTATMLSTLADTSPLEAIKHLAPAARDAMLVELLAAHFKRRKAKAKAQKRWRTKAGRKGAGA